MYFGIVIAHCYFYIETSLIKMSEEMLAAAAVCLYSAYSKFLDAHLSTRNRAIQRYRMMKSKQLRRNCWLPSSRNLTRRYKKRQDELPAQPSQKFSHFIPMSSLDFEYLLDEVSRVNENQDSSGNNFISAKSKLELTLRYLATGDSYGSLSSYFNVSTSVISKVIPEVCSIINELLNDLIKLPTTEEEWLSKVAFQFPHCLGALDVRQIIMEPACTEVKGDVKGMFSVLLFSVVDSDCCFTFVDVKNQDRHNHDKELQIDVLEKIYCSILQLPDKRPLPESEIELPYVFVANESFDLSEHIMVPFSGYHVTGSPERIFNDQVACSRAIVENAFGIMSSAFGIFKKPIHLDAEKTSTITTTCILLHNFLRKSNSSRNMYSPPELIDTYAHNQIVFYGTWRSNVQNNFIPYQLPSRKIKDENGLQTRFDFMNYICSNNISVQLEAATSE